MKRLCLTTAMTLVLLASSVGIASAAVSADQAAKLKTTLTPVGAEKAGNADGSIPAWTGGMTGSAADYYKNGRRPDPFAGEKPEFSITAANKDQYQDKLSEGVKGLFAKYPESFRLDVYKTRRTAANPQWYYDNTFRNATAGKIIDQNDQKIPSGVFGGTPFPIPQDGMEAMWNHILRWEGTRHYALVDGILVTAEGKRVLTASSSIEFWNPFLDPTLNKDNFNNTFMKFKTTNSGPPIRAGEALIVIDKFDHSEDRAWVYLTGQRRVRMLPNACCDTPSPASAGVTSFDEYYVFANTPSRFDWKLLGKKEILVPYNTNKTLVPTSTDTVLSDHHMNPDYIRWELHRVWVVDATLRSGQRHVYPHGVYYIDEDSWNAVLGERYDGKGTLTRVMWNLPVAMPDLPGQISTINGFYDLSSGAWYVANLPNAYNEQWNFTKPSTDSDYTSDALAADGVR